MSKLTFADEKLLEAAHDGDLTTVKKALLGIDFQKKAAIEARDPWKQTALIIAAANGYKEIVQYLIEQGANMETKDRYNKTPLIKATENGHREVLQYLVEKGANIEAKSKNGETPLIKAVENGNIEAVQHLLGQGANIEAKDKWQQTPLKIAIMREHDDIVQYLMEQGAKIEPKDQEKSVVLMNAALKHQILEMSTEQLADLPQSDPTLLQKIIVLGQLAAVFERLPYALQMPLYKSTRDKMKPEEKKSIENIIRAARQNQKSNTF